METIINASLMLRLLNIEEFFTHQSLINHPNDPQKISELINIKKKQTSLQEMLAELKKNEEDTEGGGGGGGGTIRGLRGKNDARFKGIMKKR